MKVIKVNEIDCTLPTKFINNEGLCVAVVNAQILAELQKMNPYKVALTAHNADEEVYFVGMCGGYYIYVDTNLLWDENVITLCEDIEEYEEQL